MLDIILERHILYVLMGIFTVVGLLSKIIVSTTLKKLVRAAGNMSKSSHPLMRLVRAKFEHACMVSDKVENVSVFVDKYLYEYRVLGFRIHSLQRVERVSVVLCLLSGAAGALAEYGLYGMSEEVLRLGGGGAALAIVIYLVQVSTDEKYRLEAARNYMVDYLENVCLHRYERANQKEQKRMIESERASEMAFERLENAEAVTEDDAVDEEVDLLEAEELEEGVPEYAEAEAEAKTEILQTRSKRQSRKLKKASRALAAASERAEREAEDSLKTAEKAVDIGYAAVEQENETLRDSAEDLSEDFENTVFKMSAKEKKKESNQDGREKVEKSPAKDMLIRQILEEYMA